MHSASRKKKGKIMTAADVKQIKAERNYKKSETVRKCRTCRHLHSINSSMHRCELIGTDMPKFFAINADFVCDRFEGRDG